jgi:hypothetical protein
VNVRVHRQAGQYLAFINQDYRQAEISPGTANKFCAQWKMHGPQLPRQNGLIRKAKKHLPGRWQPSRQSLPSGALRFWR